MLLTQRDKSAVVLSDPAGWAQFTLASPWDSDRKAPMDQDDQAKLEQWLKEVAWQASEREGMETQRRQAREAAFQADLQAQSADQQLLQAQQRALELALQRAAHAEQTAARYSRELQEEKSESDQLAAQLKIQVR